MHTFWCDRSMSGRRWQSIQRPGLGLVLILVAILGAWPATAGKPKYSRLGATVGLGIEVKGGVNDKGLFVATRIEALDEPRDPKLRGRLDAVNRSAGTVTMFGMDIEVNDRTEFTSGTFAELEAGRRVEIKCRVDAESGRWRARSIDAGQVKDSSKIKGTITELFMDGTPPDTLSISGLLVLLEKQTNFEQAGVMPSPTEDEFFGDLALPDASYASRGYVTPSGNTLLYAEYRHNTLRSEDFDLSERYASDRDETLPELRGRWSGYWNPHIRTFVDLRLRHKIYLSSDEGLESDGLEFHLNQIYVLLRDLGGQGIALQAGRQRFDEPREWIYDEYLDGVRGFLYGAEHLDMELAYIHGFHPLKEKFATWTDYMAKLNWRVAADNTISGYVLARSDSDSARNRQPIWWGLRYLGEPHRYFSTWVELALMRGEDKHRDLRAWAADVGGTFTLKSTRFMPSISLGYALGSGDETGGDEVDNGFRQTGYQDNSARLGGVASVRYYGLAVDPELSNLEVITAGAGFRPLRGSSIEVLYHRYRQQYPDDDLRGDLVDPPARPNGVSDDIGWGTDLVLGFPRLWDLLSASFTYASFHPGAAFDPRRNRADLFKLNITMRFWTS